MRAANYSKHSAVGFNNSLSVRVAYVSPATYANTVGTGIFFGVLFLVNVVTNVIIFFAIRRNRNLKSRPFYLILQSFLVSDFLSAITSVGYWYMLTIGFDEYAFPDIFCKMTYIGDHVTSYVTSLHILFLTWYRYYCVIYWEKASKVTTRKAQKIIFGIWMVCLVVGGLGYFTVQAQDVDRTKFYKPSCSGNPGKTHIFTRIYVIVVYPLFFVLPFVSICVATAAMVRSVISKKATAQLRQILSEAQIEARLKKNRRLVKGLLAVNGMYAFGLIPMALSILFLTWKRGTNDSHWLIQYAMIIAYGCLRLSEAINPFVYLYTSTDLRKEASGRLKSFIPVICRRGNDDNRSNLRPKTITEKIGQSRNTLHTTKPTNMETML